MARHTEALKLIWQKEAKEQAAKITHESCKTPLNLTKKQAKKTKQSAEVTDGLSVGPKKNSTVSPSKPGGAVSLQKALKNEEAVTQ